MNLLNEEQARKHIAALCKSKAYWIIPDTGQSSRDFIQVLEKRYYDGDANIDFQIIMGGFGGAFGIAFAAKRHCSPDQLKALLLEYSDVDYETQTHDVLLITEPGNASCIMSIMEWLIKNERLCYMDVG